MGINRQAVRVTLEAGMDNSEISPVDILLICVFLALVTVFVAHVMMT